MKNIKIGAVAATTLLLGACASEPMMEKSEAPFGGPDSVAYAGDLWRALEEARLVGSNAIETKAYPGQHPHGAVLQNVDGTLTVNGVTGPVIVKTNYGGDGASVESVTMNPSQYLAAVTVMFKRPGYDPENNDWFWAKYLPDGSLDKNPKGMQLAGRVAKVDPPAGCIACHSAAPGGDMVFTHDRFK